MVAIAFSRRTDSYDHDWEVIDGALLSQSPSRGALIPACTQTTARAQLLMSQSPSRSALIPTFFETDSSSGAARVAIALSRRTASYSSTHTDSTGTTAAVAIALSRRTDSYNSTETRAQGMRRSSQSPSRGALIPTWDCSRNRSSRDAIAFSRRTDSYEELWKLYCESDRIVAIACSQRTDSQLFTSAAGVSPGP